MGSVDRKRELVHACCKDNNSETLLKNPGNLPPTPHPSYTMPTTYSCVVVG
jgi:hypothetical protein